MEPILDVFHWDSLHPDERERLAEGIARVIPGLEYDSTEEMRQNGVWHHVAFFSCRSMRFALIPGAKAVLGYDPRGDWRPNEEERDYWDRYHRGIGKRSPSLALHIAQFLSPFRSVAIEPFLLELAPTALGVRVLAPKDPMFDPTMAAKLTPGVGGLEVPVRDGYVEYSLDDDGDLHAQVVRPVTQSEARAELRAEGFRLPTSDEWEYACAACARTLFRWGDHCPAGSLQPLPRRPPGLSLFDAIRNPGLKQYLDPMGSADKSIRPWDDPSTEPNGFGLTIAGADSAVQELCEDPGVLRGGDLAIGMLERDFFTGYWLPLAPSFQDRVPPSEQGMPRTQLAVRRARSLPELAKRMIARPEQSPK